MKNTSVDGSLEFYRLYGEQARPYFNAIAELRLSVFYDFPYLYEGSLENESKYLETYFAAEESFIFLIKDDNNFVGMTSCIKASQEEESLQRAFKNQNISSQEVLYLGESVLLSPYRGRGIGKLFFEEREKFGQSIGLKQFSICAVVRDDSHPLRPSNYRNLIPFWNSIGYRSIPGMTTEYAWKDRGEVEETAKLMQYWMKILS